MSTVRNILQKKGNIVFSISPDSSVYDGLEYLQEKNIGGIVVVENGKLIGVFTEGAFLKRNACKGDNGYKSHICEFGYYA